MADYKQLCVELLAWAEKTSSHYYGQPDVIQRARAALAEPEPEVEPTLCEEFTMILNEARCNSPGRVIGNIELGRRLVAAVERFKRAQPEPEGPTDEELVDTLKAAIIAFPPRHPEASHLSPDEYEVELEIRKARTVLARWGRPS